MQNLDDNDDTGGNVAVRFEDSSYLCHATAVTIASAHLVHLHDVLEPRTFPKWTTFPFYFSYEVLPFWRNPRQG